MLATLSPSTAERFGRLLEEVHAVTGDPARCMTFVEAATRERLDAIASAPSLIADVVDRGIVDRAVEALLLVQARMGDATTTDA